MSAQRKLSSKVTLFAAIERRHHDALRELAFKKRKSLAAIVREALEAYLDDKTKKGR